MAVYYVDSINGSNDNDGSAPDKAFADFFAVDSDATHDDPSIYWVRGTSTFTLSVDVKIDFKRVIFWPVDDTKSYYADRPQDAIDAGWDDDTIAPKIDMVSYKFDIQRNGDDEDQINLIEFYNTEFDADDTDNTPTFIAAGGDFILKDSVVTNHRKNNHGSLLKYGDVDPGGIYLNMLFSGINYTSDNTGSLVSLETDNACDWNKELIIENSTIDSKKSLLWTYHHGSNQYHGYTLFKVINSKILLEADFYTNSSYYEYNQNVQKFTDIILKDSKISSNRFVFYITGNSSYSSNSMKININNCSLTTINEMFYPNGTSSGGSYATRYYDFNITNSEIKCNTFISQYYKCYFINKIYLSNNTFDMSHLINLNSDCQDFNSISFIDNIVNNCSDNFIYLDRTPSGKSYFRIKDSNFEKDIFNKFSNFTASLSNVRCDENISTENVTNEEVFIFNSDIIAIHGKGLYSISKSAFNRTNDDSPVSNCSSITFDSCDIDIARDPICLESGRAVIIDSKIQMDLDKDIAGLYKIYNSNVNDTDTVFFSKENFNKTEISSVYRKGGSNGSLFIVGSYPDPFFQVVNDIYQDIPDNKYNVTAYVASSKGTDIFNTTSIDVNMEYKDTDGNMEVKSMEQSTDDSDWDGLDSDAIKLKFIATLPDNVDTTKKLHLIINVYSPERTEKNIYVDLNVGIE